MRRNFTVPIYPHLKKFIQKRFQKNGSIDVSATTSFGKMLMLCLRDNRKTSEFNDQYRDRLTEEITIELTKEMSELTPRQGKLMRINIYGDNLFKEALLVWIEAQGEDGIAALSACKSFLKFYDIDENEYGLLTAYQYWQRSKQKVSS